MEAGLVPDAVGVGEGVEQAAVDRDVEGAPKAMTSPLIVPSSASRTISGCGAPISHGGQPFR